MFATLIRNTAISAVAYFIISVVGIWVTGLLASTYGLAAFGMITLSRLFTATGLVGIFDLGAPENASHVIAQARATGDWADAWRSTKWLWLFVLISSIFCAALILLVSISFSEWIGVEPSGLDIFRQVLVVSAIALPLCLTAQVAEGVIRGFEHYSVARGLEVAASLGYAIGCWVLMTQEKPFFWVIYLFVVIALIRAIAAYHFAWGMLKSHVATAEMRHTKHIWHHMLARTRLVAPNKILSTLQTQSVPLVVGLTVGVTGAGIYDLLMRLPRFLKATLGLLNSAVLPFASRLEAANSQSTLRTLHEHGLVVVAFLTAPPTFALATFSKPLLDLWVGDALARYWLWQSLAFSTPLVTAIIGFASMSMFGRSNVIKFMALMILARIAIQYGMAFLFIGKIGERAFIFGATVAVIITAVWELKLLLKLQKVGKRARFSLLNVFLLCAALGALVFPITIYVTSIPKLLFSLVLFCLFSWAVVWFAVMPKDFRERLLSHLKNTSYWT
ncbi:MAG: hypothetical protein ING17_09010 [Burkholderiales bacterium]|nr:hypothetical protein [Burkholderiales bacterium]